MKKVAHNLSPFFLQRLLIAGLIGLLSWYITRHALYWFILQIVVHTGLDGGAPKHWLAANPESTISVLEQRFAAACAIIAGALAFFRPLSVATGTAKWTYDRMAGAIPQLVGIAIPTVATWFFARLAIHTLFYPAMHHPPSDIDRGTELTYAGLITYLVGSSAMVWQTVWTAEWRWSNDVSQRENVSPTFLRLASGITSGPFDAPTTPGCGPMIIMSLLGIPFFLPWLVWRIFMAAAVILGIRWMLGRFLASRHDSVSTLPTTFRLRSVGPTSRHEPQQRSH